ncbi:signal peptide, CUB and EGF-like domain-containing protein 1, partial [Stegodyphus dumicola]|uniref:signal peptide, CUB and EGF-like domain-containing protein 1 n=1 Tax=Stegodyphus dumicola TaxID=202533 RepID=UPI0015B1638E
MCDQRVRNGKSVSKWIPFPSAGQSPDTFKVPWPDCSKMRSPKALNISLEMSYPVQYCTEEVIKEMKERFIKTLKVQSQNEKIFKMICPKDKGCSPENVNITCSEALSRVRRSLRISDVHAAKPYELEILKHSPSESRYRRFLKPDVHPVLKISFSLELHTNESDTTEEKPNEENIIDELNKEPDSLLTYMNEKVSGNIKDVYNLTSVPSPEINYEIMAVCSIGQIRVRNSCLNCPAGTFKDDITESCKECPTATYQDKEKSLSCLPCPKGYTTYSIMSKSLEDCKAPCLPGTYSNTTFEPCLTCSLHTYQEYSGRKDCRKCSPGLYTSRVGSNSSSDCA